jgi:hypothetical protein
MVVVFLQVLLRLVQREMSSIDKAQWFNWPPLAQFVRAKGNAAASAPSDTEVSDASTRGPAPPPKPSGNGKSAGGQPQQQGKKRKK